MRKQTRLQIGLLMSVILVIILCTVNACSKDDFRSTEINNKLGHYSLEYPAIYKQVKREDLGFRVPFSVLALEYPTQTVEAEIYDPETGEVVTVSGKTGVAFIEIKISDYKAEFGGSYTTRIKLESILRGAAKWDNYELLERSPINICGVEGETVRYIQDRLMPIPVEDGENLNYHRIIMFDYNGMTWTLEAECHLEMRDQIDYDFDNIIQTFQIIE